MVTSQQGGGVNPSHSGATIDDVRLSATRLAEVAQSHDEMLRRAARFAAGGGGKRRGVGGAPDRSHDGRVRGGGKLSVEPGLNATYLTLKVESGPRDTITFEQQRAFTRAFEEIQDAAEELQLAALRHHLDVVVSMVAWRSENLASLTDDEAAAFVELLVVARKVDALAALASMSVAAVQSQTLGEAGAAEVDRFFRDLSEAPPIVGGASRDEVRALYDNLVESLAHVVAELNRLSDERLAGVPGTERLVGNVERMFASTIEQAKKAEARPDERMARELARETVTFDVRPALLDVDSVLFPALGVVIRGVEVATELLEGRPQKAVELAASMIPGGSTALPLARTAATVVG